MDVVDPQALAAICAPMSVTYDFPTFASASRPIRDFLPSFHNVGNVTWKATNGINALAKAVDPLRGTGRTSDMLWEAACAKDENKPVLIIVHDQKFAEYCIRTLNGGWWGLDLGDFTTVAMLKSHYRGCARGTQLFIDHYSEELIMDDPQAQGMLTCLWQSLS
jgi:hypothetical protein